MTSPWKRALLALSQDLYEAGVRFALGGSGLLFFKGIYAHPSDIDLIIHPEDHQALKQAIKHYPLIEKPRNPKYLTEGFYTFKVLGIDVDAMVRFQIKTKEGIYEIPYEVSEMITYNGIFLPLGSLEEWKTAYQHMGRTETIKRIHHHQSFQLTTDRLIIRHLDYADANAMLPYVSDETNMYYERRAMDGLSLQQFLSEVVPSNVMYAVIRTSDQQFLGHLYLGQQGPNEFQEYMVGYIMAPSFHNQGYCTEATRAIVNYAFSTLHAHRVSARCNPDNIASWRVMEKVGLRREGHLKARVCFKYDTEGNPIWWDELIYGITSFDWKELQQ